MIQVIFGGSFDPVHFGHLAIADAIHREYAPEKLIWLPAQVSPHKLNAPPVAAQHRFAMLQSAIEGRLNEEICRFEIERPGPSYSVETLQHLHRRAPDSRIEWVIGADTLTRLPQWHRAAELFALTSFLVLPRPHLASLDLATFRNQLVEPLRTSFRAQYVPMQPVAASSLDIRSRLHADQGCQELIPQGVADYIEKHALYRD
jgi:nicotinate-nucleotide adenylyltransferase